jgi:hypothetical protein
MESAHTGYARIVHLPTQECIPAVEIDYIPELIRVVHAGDASNVHETTCERS